MRNRIMRAIVFFDLPTVYSKEKRDYLKFRKFLLSEGFIMLQESVYSKLLLNSQQILLEKNRIKKNSPKKGLIQILTVTEKQYSQMEYIIGTSNSNVIDSEERLIIL